MKTQIMEILNEVKPECDFSSSENFIEDGMLDSFDLITIISYIEEKFNIVVDGLDMIPENFISVEAIAQMVEKNGFKNGF